MLAEQLGHFLVSVLESEVERRDVLAVDGVYLGALFEQNLGYGQVASGFAPCFEGSSS